MVRRLPVLQNGTPETSLSTAEGVAATVGLAALVWAPLLWLVARLVSVQRWGPAAMACSYVLACGLASAVGLSRVAARARRTAAFVSAALAALGLWGLSWLGGVFVVPSTGWAALLGILVLSFVGFPAGLLVLLWRERRRMGR